MKKLFFVMFIIFIININSYASDKNPAAGKKGAVGFMLGWPSGFMGRYMLPNEDAIAGGLGIINGSHFYCFSDYNLNLYQYETINVYVGAGAAVYGYEYREDKHEDKEDKIGFDVRMPIGAEVFVDRISSGFFLEIIPSLRVNDPDFNIRGYIGGRYYF